MPKVDIWMPIFIGDYLRDTQELTGPEHGAYFLLLMHYWQKKGKIGCDVDRLARVCKSDVETTRFILGYYFNLIDGNYKNKRADIEIENADNRRNTAQENGKRGGRPPKEPTNNRPVTGGLPGGEPDANRARNPQKSSSPSPSPSPSPSKLSSEKREENPLTFESFAKQCAETWNDLGIKPAFRFTTSAGLTGKEREGFLTSSDRYSMDEIIQAMRNYHDIGESAEHEVFPKGYGLSGFLAGGVEKFTDDAEPWTRCRKKPNGEQTTEERNAMISKIAAEISKPEPRREQGNFSDDEYFADDPPPHEPLVFDAKKAMSDIRKMSGRNEARRA